MARAYALVTGATGIVGYRIAQHLASIGKWDVVGVSRKPPPRGAKFRYLQADLTDVDDCREKLRPLKKITHLFYAARYDHSITNPEPIDTNLAMLENVVDAIERNAGSLRHVHLVHGTKYYGAPYGKYKTPSRESDPRTLINNFYFAQQDFIVDRQKGRSWGWTISRPQVVSDYLGHIARSIPWGIAVFASISKAYGIPLSFPGRPGNYTAIQQCTDAEHLAKAAAWVSTHEECSNEAFNVTNGDYFRWENLWPQIADFFRIPLGYPQPMALTKAMADKGKQWDALVRKHRLRRNDFKTMVVWPYVDYALSLGYDRMSDVTKLHKFGFHEIVDTEEMCLRFLDYYRRGKMIPA